MQQQAARESAQHAELARSLTPRPNWQRIDAFGTGEVPGGGLLKQQVALSAAGPMRALIQPQQFKLHACSSITICTASQLCTVFQAVAIGVLQARPA